MSRLACTSSRPCLVASAGVRPSIRTRWATSYSRLVRRNDFRVRAEETTDASTGTANEASTSDNTEWMPLMRPEDLPKGERKEFKVKGENVLLFWYRNEIYCIQSRSPAEGFYSEGFMKAKFTQDYGIVCPTTGSVFSLKTGEVLDWYPNNPVLRALTPVDSVSKLKILPVKVTQDSIQIDASDLTGSRFSRGGADSSLENNNVFFSEPRVYIEGTDPDDPFNDTAAEGSGPTVANAATALVSLLGAAVLSVAGTAFFIYYENFIGLGIFWAVGFAVVAYYYYSTVLTKE